MSETNSDELVSLMLGRGIVSYFPKKENFIKEKVILETRNLNIGNALRNISFKLHMGEILGVGGLVGQGQSPLFLSLFGIIALIVSAIGMFNTMTIALLERTQEIGIMKTLGASSLDIWKMFLTESMMIGFFGGAFGVIIGFLASRILNIGLNFLAKSFGGLEIELFYIPVWFIIFILS